jgi:ComF family protein
LRRGCQLTDDIFVNKWLNSVQSLLYPPSCLLCGARGTQDLDLCSGCLSALPIIEVACQRCALPLTGKGSGRLCGHCQQQPPAFDRSISLFRYQPPVAGLIQQLKFNGRLAIARSLGELLAQRVSSVHPLPEAVLPVPLHATRLRERGFNQALELARPLAHALKLPLLTQHCQRTRATTAQTSLSAKQRRKNIRGVFQVVKPLPARRIAIVDDVMTTGQTVNELARTLRKAGVTQVDVWVCARAELD